MDKVICLLLNDTQFCRNDNRDWCVWGHGVTLTSKQLEEAEQVADKLENWLNELSL